MEINGLDLYAFQLLHFFVNQYQYQMVTVREQNKELWLLNQRHEEYPLIHIINASDEEVAAQEEHMLRVKTALLGKESVKKILVLNTNPQSSVIQAASFSQQPIGPDRLEDEHVKELFSGVEKAAHNVEDPQKEYLKLSRSLERKQMKLYQERLKALGIKKAPKLTVGLIALCVVITVLATMCALYLESDVLSIILWGAYYKMNIVSMHEYWRFLTAGFLHIDIFHLFANMMALYIIGGACEKTYQKTQYLAILLVSVFTGNLFVFLTEGNTLGLGISGGVFGLLGAFIVSLWESGMIKHPMVRSNVIRLLSMNIIISFFPGISLFAHLGGFISGAFLGFIFTKSQKWESLRRHVTISFAILMGLSCGMCMKYQSVEPLQPVVDRTLLKTVRALGFEGYADKMEQAYLQYYTEEELGL